MIDKHKEKFELLAGACITHSEECIHRGVEELPLSAGHARLLSTEAANLLCYDQVCKPKECVDG